jgi:hypothetical protein
LDAFYLGVYAPELTFGFLEEGAVVAVLEVFPGGVF